MRLFTRTLLTLLAAVSILAGTVATGHARAVQIEGPDHERTKRNPVVYFETVRPHVTRAELADGSVWRATDCRQEDSRNCFWNARRLGNGYGDSFLNLAGHRHYFRAPADVRVTLTAHCREDARVYVFRLRNAGDSARNVNAYVRSYPVNSRLGDSAHGFRVRAGETLVERYRLRGDDRERVTYRSQGRIIMRAYLTRGGCGR